MKVSFEILNSGKILKTFTHVMTYEVEIDRLTAFGSNKERLALTK